MKINRLEVIDHRGHNVKGRVFSERFDNFVNVELSLQDDDETLKLFITDNYGYTKRNKV